MGPQRGPLLLKSWKGCKGRLFLKMKWSDRTIAAPSCSSCTVDDLE